MDQISYTPESGFEFRYNLRVRQVILLHYVE